VDELPHAGVVVQVTPAEDGAEEPQTVRVLAAELHGDVERLAVGKDPLLWGKRLAAQLDLDRGVCQQVAVPIGCGPQAAQITASPVAASSRSTIATVSYGWPVLRPTWVNATNVRPTAGPALCS
jgi:hypothetical protein